MRGRNLALLVASPVAAVAILAASGLDDTLVYYRTPGELAQAPGTERVRVGGLVVPGSVRTSAGELRFTLTDGVDDVDVRYRGTPPGVFQEGQSALVEGRPGDSSVLEADSVLVKHSNEYTAQEPRSADAGGGR